jgi:hypothetical protein
MPWHFAILGGAAAVAGLGIAIGEGSLAMALLIPVGSTVAMTTAADQLMKVANRKAQRRIADGEFPDLKALRAGDSDRKDERQPTAV